LTGLPDVLVRQFVEAAGAKAVGKALGNAVSANVLERMLPRLLYAAQLVDTEPESTDFWSKICPLPGKEVRASSETTAQHGMHNIHDCKSILCFISIIMLVWPSC
jgi:hypothetical protein